MHIPVLLKEVIHFLDPKPGKKFIDATYGFGGHGKAITEDGGIVLGIDRDPELAKKYQIAQGNFSDLKEIAAANGFTEVDGILFDLGLGSHQLDDPDRGFSFQKSGPLDMRYNATETLPSLTAAQIIGAYSEKDLIKLFQKYGEEYRFGKRVARAVLEARKNRSIERTDELFELIKKALPSKFRFRAGDTARRIFQALRIEVNQELTSLEKALPQALDVLKEHGRLVVVSFHSLEDRIVKIFFTQNSKACICPPEFPECRCGSNRARLKILTKKPVTASEEEIKTNSRARSAKLRAAEKL